MPKKDGGLRFYMDYKGLNKIIKKNKYFLFLINETFDRLSGIKIFSKINLKNVYYRIRIKAGYK